MRSPLFAALLAAVACGSAKADGQFIPLATPNAQATKFSENGDYLVSFMYAQGGTRWSRATGTEEMIQGMFALNGINNAGTVSGSAPLNGGYDSGGNDLPALVPVGAGAPTILPLPADAQNAEAYDVADDGSAVGLLWSDDYSVTRAYYYSAATQDLVVLPVTDPVKPSRGNSISADGTVIAGWNDDPETGFRRGVVWDNLVPVYPTGMMDGAEYNVGEASAVSGNGRWVVGNQYPTMAGAAAWRYNVETGEVTEIPGIPFAFGVSDDGKTVVGASGFFDFPARAAYVWTEEYGSQLLTDYLDARNIAYPPDWGFSGGLTAISGDGTMAAGWTVEGAVGMQSFIVTGLDSPIDAIFASGFDGPPPVKDPGFEASQFDNTNPYWDSGNTHPDANPGVFYNFGGARTGGWYAEFGGFQDAEAETQFFSQEVEMLSVAPAYLNYWRFAAGLPDRSAIMTVSIDGTPVQTVDFAALGAPDDDYIPVSIDIGSYADGGTHTIRFEYVYPGGGSDGGILIDDVTIDSTSVESRAPSSTARRTVEWKLPKTQH